MTGETTSDPRPVVYIHLPIEQNAEAWRARHARGEGAEVTPYGYHQAEAHGFRVVFSRSHAEGAVVRLVRRVLFRLLGFDPIHAWRNRDRLRRCAAVWTHTEREWLAILALFALPGFIGADRPKVLAQIVWLMDRWDRMSGPMKALYLTLMRRADLLTTLSPVNLDRARRLCPKVPSLFVPYGISLDPFLAAVPARRGDIDGPIRIVAPGSDMHRDWPALLEAVRGRADIDLTILTPKEALIAPLAAGMPNVRVRRARSFGDLKASYDAADLMVVPLKPNLHASGITVMLEAAGNGLPMVCTRTGGLDAYFGEDEIAWVPPSDAGALRAAIERLARDPAARAAQAAAARTRLLSEDYSSARYVRTHCRLTIDLLGMGAPMEAGDRFAPSAAD